MSRTSLALLVVRAIDLDRAVAFYRALGLEFVKERHGDGAEHYACDLDGTIFEIYPITRRSESPGPLRLGFRVPCLAKTLAMLKSLGTPVESPPAATQWGTRAVVRDPDGRKVEIIESESMPPRDCIEV